MREYININALPKKYEALLICFALIEAYTENRWKSAQATS